jgi:tRNA1(Val) A37 N6-methylase TrmN6
MKNKLINLSGIENKVAKMALPTLLNYIELCKDIEFMLEKACQVSTKDKDTPIRMLLILIKKSLKITFI